MTTPFLDTNILVRHLTNDHPIQSPACFRLIQAIEHGQVTAWTSELVIAEIVFVLGSKQTYNLPRAMIRDLLLPLINLSGVRLAHKGLYERAFDLYTSLPIDYIDAYHAALMESRGEPDLYSYDAHFDRVPDLRRLEP